MSEATITAQSVQPQGEIPEEGRKKTIVELQIIISELRDQKMNNLPDPNLPYYMVSHKTGKFNILKSGEF